ncbi:DNA-binding protein REB1 [Colletotrichum chlorophyti]|uniref:DNA-binding protein REB1 n=1 Tax=Colletotrichum chlorophyti TaxID=708187 RepID=A0A1Q8S896_9PEZI|nr:DNA-binding protein REB1 [Colletotrichum chlorophyti]
MFRSLSNIFTGHTPRKNSSPGPTRPDSDSSRGRDFPSTAPAEYPAGPDETDDQQISIMASQDEEDASIDVPAASDDFEAHDGTADMSDYEDPFLSMKPFSTLNPPDNDAAIPTYSASEDDGPRKKSKKSKKKQEKKEEKKARRRKNKSRTDSSDSSHLALALLSPQNSGATNHSAAAEAVESDSEANAEEREPAAKPKKRKRGSQDVVEDSDAQGSGVKKQKGKKKKKKKKEHQSHKHVEGTETTDQFQNGVSESSPHSTALEVDVDGPVSDHDSVQDTTLMSEPVKSHAPGVSRQLFLSAKPTLGSVTGKHGDQDDGMTDDDNQVTMSSPSIAAQRRRSMSRGSQISVLRQGLVREAMAQPGKIPEAVESAEGSSDEDNDGQSENEGSSQAQQSPASTTQLELESVSHLEDVDMADASSQFSAAGAAGNDDSFAEDLPPSSQPPREYTPSIDANDVEDDEEPQLPVSTFGRTVHAGNSAKKPITYSKKDARHERLAGTPRAIRQRKNANGDGAEPDNLPSSARRSVHSTASRRQRSKPNFFSDISHPESDANENSVVSPKPDVPAISSTEAVEHPQRSKKAQRSSKESAASAAEATATARKVAKKPTTSRTEAVPKKKKSASHEKTLVQPTTKKEFVNGKFTDEEIQKITRAIEKYRDDNNLTQHQMNDLIQMKKRKKSPVSKETNGQQFDGHQFVEMWNVICSTLPNRHRQKVIDVCRKEFHNFKARGGKWTPREDAKLEELHSKYNGSWVLIADELNRHPGDVRDRYRNYVACGGVEGHRRWTEAEEQELVQHVVTAYRRMDKAPASIKKPYRSFINWQTISELMGHKRSRLQCMKKFNSLNVELSPNDTLQSSRPTSALTWRLEKARRQIQEMSPEDKHEMVRSILDGAAGRDEKIRWPKIANTQFRQKWNRPTLKLLWYRLKQLVPGYEDKSTRDCARWLLDDAETNSLREAKLIDGGYASGDTEDELNVVNPPKKASRRKTAKRKIRSAETVHDDDDDDDDLEDEDVDDEDVDDEDIDNENTGVGDSEFDETSRVDTPASQGESPSAQNQAWQAASQRLTNFAEKSLRLSPRPAAMHHAMSRLGPNEMEAAVPSPMKKRIRLSGSKSTKRFAEDDDDSQQSLATSQYETEEIPDRVKEKREAFLRRKSSGNRLRSTPSVQPDSIQNSDIDDDMPPIHVPPSTQPATSQASETRPPKGKWARKSGANVLPGEAMDLTEDILPGLNTVDGSKPAGTGSNKPTNGPASASPKRSRATKRGGKAVDSAA